MRRCAPARSRLRPLARLRSFSRELSPVTGAGSPVPAQDNHWPGTLSEGTRASSASWISSGACHGADTELFFPVTTAGGALKQINSAKAVCGSCQVRADCLSYALETMQHGIWGGTTWDERAEMRAISRRALRRAARKKDAPHAPAELRVPAPRSTPAVLREAGPA
jgi:WhiB family transcriptional regulator, redox-sensing transcriptional regulator